jgi:hypothetical protein
MASSAEKFWEAARRAPAGDETLAARVGAFAREWRAWLPAAGVFGLSLVGFLRTLKPTFGWGDSSELATAVRFLGIGHSPGYPTFVMAAHAFSRLPLGDFAHRVNLFTATCGAAAILLAYLLFFKVTKSRLAAFVAAGALGFSYTFWDATTEFEVHTFHLCFVGGLVWLVLRWRESGRDPFLYYAALLFGLSLGNHPLITLLVPAVIYLIVAERGWRFLAARRTLWGLGLILLGLSVYIYVPVRAAANPPPGVSDPHSFRAFVAHLTSPGSRAYMFIFPARQAAANVGRYPYRILNEFGWAGALLGLAGVGVAWRRERRMLLFALLVMGATIFYAANYAIFDIYQYYLQSYLMWGLLVAFGLAGAAQLAGWGIARIGGRTEWLAGTLVGLVMLTLPFCQFSDNVRRVDASRDYGAEDYARAVFGRVEPNALILADWWAIAPLGYLKYVEGQRKDVTLVPALALARPEDLERFLKKDFLHKYPAVYACEEITYEVRRVLKRYRVVREGQLLRLIVDPPERAALEVELDKTGPGPRGKFGSGLELAEARVGPEEAKQGSYVTVDYTWSRTGKLGEVDTVTRVWNEEGEPAWVDRGRLAHDLYPISEWAPGQGGRERHVVYVGSEWAPGRYEITLQVKGRGRGGKLLAAEGPGGAARAGRGGLVVGGFEVIRRPRPPLPGMVQRLVSWH